jgi:NAD(P)-dependent dehydrogenase (short-subunit alcohol dehydrogenase family)
MSFQNPFQVMSDHPGETIILTLVISFLASLAGLLWVIGSWWYTTLSLPSKALKNPPKHVFITGGSKGLGLGLAKTLVSLGSNVTIISRGESALKDALRELESIVTPSKSAPAGKSLMETPIVQGFRVDACDFKALVELFENLKDSSVGLPDWVILNAGSAQPGFVAENLPSKGSQGLFSSQIRSNFETSYKVLEALFTVIENDSMDPVKLAGLGADVIANLPTRLILVGSVLSTMSFIGYSAYSAR